VTATRPLVTHVTTTDMSLELLLGPQLEAFSRDGFEVVGISAAGPFVEAVERRGVRHVPLRHATRSFAPASDARALFELVQLFRHLRPTIVHTHNPKPGLYGRVAARLARVPVIVNTVHGLYAQADTALSKRVLVYGAERAASVCSHAELVQNEEDVATLRRIGVPARKLTLLGNGIDLRRFDPAVVPASELAAARAELGARHNDDIVVGTVGRLVHEKGYLELFDAARQLRDVVPRLHFAVIGGADHEKADALTPAELEHARAAGFRFLGARDEVVPLYAGMDLFVLASHREGFPRAAMEAAAMGVPIVATNIRGCRQVVDDGVTGALVPVRDSHALAGAIRELATDLERRRRFGRAAREKARREFDQQRCIDITLETYRRLMKKRSASRGVPDR
jgi:glycosyltransferase involved in cell wall biosynthesis